MVSTKKQAKKAKKGAQSLWSDQQALLDRANGFARDALPQAQQFARETVLPGAKTVYAERVAPTLDRGAKAGRAAGAYAGSTALDALQGTLVPAVTSAAAAAIALAQEAGDRIGQAGTSAAQQGDKAKARLNTATKDGERAQVKARAKVKAAATAGGAAAKTGRAAAKTAAKSGRAATKAATKAGAKRVAKATGRDRSGIGVGGVLGIALLVSVLAGIGYAVWQTLRADDDLWVADEDPETTPTSDAPTS